MLSEWVCDPDGRRAAVKVAPVGDALRIGPAGARVSPLDAGAGEARLGGAGASWRGPCVRERAGSGRWRALLGRRSGDRCSGSSSTDCCSGSGRRPRLVLRWSDHAALEARTDGGHDGDAPHSERCASEDARHMARRRAHPCAPGAFQDGIEQTVSEDELDRWTERISTAETLSDLFAWERLAAWRPRPGSRSTAASERGYRRSVVITTRARARAASRRRPRRGARAVRRPTRAAPCRAGTARP